MLVAGIDRVRCRVSRYAWRIAHAIEDLTSGRLSHRSVHAAWRLGQAGDHDTGSIRWGADAATGIAADLPRRAQRRPARLARASLFGARKIRRQALAATGRATGRVGGTQDHRARIVGSRLANPLAIGSAGSRIARIGRVIDTGESGRAGPAEQAAAWHGSIASPIAAVLAPRFGVPCGGDTARPQEPQRREQSTAAHGHGARGHSGRHVGAGQRRLTPHGLSRAR